MAFGETGFETTLNAAKAGADWAWASIYREFAGPVTGYLSSRGAPDPEDLAGDVLLRVSSRIHGFEGDESSFRSWVFVIAHHRLIDERRSLVRSPDLIELPSDASSNDFVGGDVESEAMERLISAGLEEAFDLLTDGQRNVLLLRIIAGLTLEETAEVVGKRVGAVKALQRRALESLLKKMDVKGVTL